MGGLQWRCSPPTVNDFIISDVATNIWLNWENLEDVLLPRQSLAGATTSLIKMSKGMR